MSLAFHVTAAALKDAADAQRYLEGLNTDAGPRFRDELERCWRYIALYPQGFQIRHRQFRYAPLAVLPYHGSIRWASEASWCIVSATCIIAP